MMRSGRAKCHSDGDGDPLSMNAHSPTVKGKRTARITVGRNWSPTGIIHPAFVGILAVALTMTAAKMVPIPRNWIRSMTVKPRRGAGATSAP